MVVASTALQDTEFAGFQALLKLFYSRSHNSIPLLCQSSETPCICCRVHYEAAMAWPQRHHFSAAAQDPNVISTQQKPSSDPLNAGAGYAVRQPWPLPQ